MKNRMLRSENFRLDLIILIVLFILLGLNSVNAQSDLQEGIMIFEKKNYYGARKFFNDYLEKNKDNAEAYYYLGRIALEEKDLEHARKYLDTAVGLDDTNSDYFTWKGIVYIQLLSTVDFMKQGLYAPTALSALENAVKLNLNNVNARMWLAGYYSEAPVFAGGSEEKTEEQYEAIIQIDPSYVPAYVNYGLVLLKWEKYDMAFENFENALKYNPEHYLAYLNIGKLSAQSGKYIAQGEFALIKFIDLAPEEYKNSLDEAWYYLGTIYLHDGNVESARSAFERAIALDPEKEEYQKTLKKLM